MAQKYEARRLPGARRASENVLPASANDPTIKSSQVRKQAAWLINRMRVSPELAMAVAELAFVPLEAR